jgi:hypothetical protein
MRLRGKTSTLIWCFLVIVAAFTAPALGFSSPNGVTPAETESIQIDPEPDYIGEVDRVEVIPENAGEWSHIDFDRRYDSPIVVMNSPDMTATQTANIQIRAVANDGFEYRLSNWPDVPLPSQSIHLMYLVVEEGTHQFAEDVTIEAGTTRVGTDYQSVPFAESFPDQPIVMTQAQSQRGDDPETTQNRNVTTAGFQTRIQEAAASDGTHPPETVGYIAIESGKGTNRGVPFEVRRTPAVVTNSSYRVQLTQGYGNYVRVLGDTQTQHHEGVLTTAIGRYLSVYSLPTETAETVATEAIGYLAISLSTPLVAYQGERGPTPKITIEPREGNWTYHFTARDSWDPGGAITEYDWEISNDATFHSEGRFLLKGFSEPGVYNVSLTVTDTGGNQATATKELVVGDPERRTTTESTTQPPTTTTTTATSTTETTTLTETTATTTTNPPQSTSEAALDSPENTTTGTSASSTANDSLAIESSEPLTRNPDAESTESNGVSVPGFSIPITILAALIVSAAQASRSRG